MASLTQRTWVWASSGRWWRTGKPGVLQPMGLRRVRHDWATEQQAAAYIHSMSIPQAQENDPQILACMTPDSPMSKTPLFGWARLSGDVRFALPVLPCTPTTPGFLDFPVSASQRLLLSPPLLLWWVVPSWGCFLEHAQPSGGIWGALCPLTSSDSRYSARAVKVKFREGPCLQRAVHPPRRSVPSRCFFS